MDDIKTLLTGEVDDQLEVIERLTTQRLAVLLSEESIPNQFQYILTDVCVKRFNRLSNEGMSSFSQEGLNIKFEDSDFADYMEEINAYLEKKHQEANPMDGVIRFL